KSEGPGLQDSLNKKTEALKTRLNAFFEEEAMPISIVNFGSLFRFDFKENLELLFYHLMEKGVFIWEWRNYFLSTAHSDSDIDFVIEKIMESALALREGGFLSSLKADRRVQSVSTPRKDLAVSLPMSKAQKQLFTLHQMTREGSKAYLVGGTVELSGDLSRERLEKAFAEAVAAQESLFLVPSSPTGELRPNAAAPTLEWDGEFLGSEGPALQHEWLNRPMDIDFDLESGPLLKGHLCRAVNGNLLLRLTGHHFAIDGISMNLLFREIINRYQGIEVTRENETIGVKDLREFIGAQDYRGEREYWRSLLSKRLDKLELPRDQRGNSDWNFDAVRYAFAFSEEETQKLRERAVKSGCTEFMYFFSVFAAWLRQLTGTEDFLIGVPVTGRPKKEFNDLIGYLTHLIPVRIDSSTCDSEGAFITSARRSLLEAYEHQNLAFSEIMDLAPRGDSGFGLAAENLISVIFNFDEPGNLQGPDGGPAKWHPTPAGFTAFDLICNITVGAEGYFLELTNRAAYVSNDLSQELGEGLVESVRKGLTAPNGIALFSGACSNRSIKRQKDQFESGPSVNVVPNMLAGIRNVFKSAPRDVAVESGKQQISFADLDRISSRVAKHLQQIGLSRGDRVIVSGRHSPELLASMVGILRAGLVMVPMDPATPVLRKHWICKDSDARAVLCEDPPSEWEGTAAEHVPINEVAVSNDAEDDDYWIDVSKDDIAYVLYTSGSTGRPKGVEISHSALANYVVWAAKYYELDKGSGVVFHGSIGFDATLTSIFPPLFSGQRIVIPEQSADPILGIANLVQESRNLSLLKLTPTHLELLNANLGNRVPQDAVGFIVLGGEAVKMGAVLPWLGADSNARVISEYGPTETVVGCWVYAIPKNASREVVVPIGRP
ncbi:MAG: AMP-binding protein, partial [Gammaproteobacteria bacterium]